VLPYELLWRKRAGLALSEEQVRLVVTGASDGSWGDAELGAFLMAAAIRGLDDQETRVLTLAMLESGEQWDLAAAVPMLADKHSTGGVGDKTSLILAPLLAACGVPVVMLTGRALGHTGGTADKLEAIPGLDLELDRPRTLALLSAVGCAIGVATGSVAPADRRLYALRDRTGTVESIPLITASILSKKLATGAAAIVFDIKTGPGAFLTDAEQGAALARNLVGVTRSLGRRASALLTDMSQPLGRWAGHACEVLESLEVLAGGGPDDLREVTLALAAEAASLVGSPLGAADLAGALADGRGRERFLAWARAQGASRDWVRQPRLPLAPCEVVCESVRPGVVAGVDTRRLGFLLAEYGRTSQGLDAGVSLRVSARLGQRVEAGEELARLYVRAEHAEAARAAGDCFTVADVAAAAPRLLRKLEIS
jgi:pyrimidine-nucleoside phosphorylase